jgi:hypothetical protein
MAYELTSIPSVVGAERIDWSCLCGFRLGVRFSKVGESTVAYELGEYAQPVTGGIGVGCPECGRRFLLPSVARQPSVAQVTSSE